MKFNRAILQRRLSDGIILGGEEEIEEEDDGFARRSFGAHGKTARESNFPPLLGLAFQ